MTARLIERIVGKNLTFDEALDLSMCRDRMGGNEKLLKKEFLSWLKADEIVKMLDVDKVEEHKRPVIKVEKGDLDIYKLAGFLMEHPFYFAKKFYAVTSPKTWFDLSGICWKECGKEPNIGEPLDIAGVELEFIVNNSMQNYKFESIAGEMSGSGSVIFFIDDRYLSVRNAGVEKIENGLKSTIMYCISKPEMCLVYGWR